MNSATDQHAEWFSYWFNAALDNVSRVIKGKRDQIATAFVCVFAEGHLLLEDVPGTGKTTLAKSIARTLGAEWRRIQFTPDLLPTDVTGAEVFDQRTADFKFREGPVFANIVLADEINRASPKTQAALLEVMEERQVTVDGVPRAVPDPFIVIGTQNPVEQEGTYRLPEAQLDRFLLRTSLHYPSLADEVDAVRSVTSGTVAEDLDVVVESTDLARMIQVAGAIHVDDAIIDYAVRLAAATRELDQLRLGVSTRGALALIRAARAIAASQGRAFVVAEDVQAVAPPALEHRMLVSPHAELRGASAAGLLSDLLDSVPAPPPIRR